MKLKVSYRDHRRIPKNILIMKGYSRISMRKLPPAKTHLNVCQMVACDKKLVYAKLQPPKSHLKDARENKEFFFLSAIIFSKRKKKFSKNSWHLYS